MARQYSAKTFLRNTPNRLLQEYFKRRGVDLGINWWGLDETDVNPIFAAMLALSDDVRNAIDADFRQVNALCSGDGTQAIVSETGHAGIELAKRFTAMGNAYERAAWTFLHEPDLFQLASSIHEMDRRGGWRRRFIGRELAIQTDAAALRTFEKKLCVFYRHQGRGRFCRVDYYARHDPVRHCFFAYPEDYATTDLGFDDRGQFQHRQRRSAFENIFVYRPEDGMLEICARCNKRQLVELETIFSTAIINMQQLPDTRGTLPFNLNVLKDAEFSFPTDPRDCIEAVELRLLRFDLPVDFGGRLTVTPDSPRASCSLHHMLDAAIDKSRMPLHDLYVSQAKLRFTFAPEPGRKPKMLTFEVTYPDRCTLRDDPHDQIARKYLRRWGIAGDHRAA